MARPPSSFRPLLLCLPLLLAACTDSTPPPDDVGATGCTSAADCSEPGAVCVAGAGQGICCVPAVEACDGRDNDCDGQVDEGLDLQTDAQHCGACGHACAAGQRCVAGACETLRESACTGGADEDGDGQADCADADCQGASCAEGCLCDAGAKRESACRDGADNDGDGQADCDDADCPAARCGTRCESAADCAGETAVCVPPAQGGAPGTCCTPSAEACDGEDNDCNGAADDVPQSACYSGPVGTQDVGVCKAGLTTCSGAQSACTGEVTPSVERCNEADDDCDGQVDEGFDLLTDADHCGGCGNACPASASCIGGNCVMPPETQCGDGQDEDGDGKTDCEDLECNTLSCGTGCTCVYPEARETLCTDRIDNDGNNGADCQDQSDCPEMTQCRQGNGNIGVCRQRVCTPP